MTYVKKIVLLVLLVALAAPVVGCGVASTPADNQRAFTRVVDFDARMMVDDLSVFMQIDRPTRNSRWVID